MWLYLENFLVVAFELSTQQSFFIDFDLSQLLRSKDVGTSRFFIPFSQLTKRLPIDSANESRVPLVALSFDQIIIVPGNPELSNVLEFIVSLKMVKTLVSRSRHTVPNFLEIEGVFISLLPSFNLMGEMAQCNES